MSSDTILLAVLIAWPVIGLTLALVLGRRGHDAIGWLLLGALFGPFAVLLAVESVQEERIQAEVVASPGHHAPGGVDVLIGFDGSAGSKAALTYVQGLLRDRIDQLTLASVVPYDGGRIDEREARRVLDNARRDAPDAGLEVVRGRPGLALDDLARQDGYDLLVVGTSTEGRLHLLGDAAVDLARASSVPVLLVPAPQPGECHDQS